MCFPAFGRKSRKFRRKPFGSVFEKTSKKEEQARNKSLFSEIVFAFMYKSKYFHYL